MPVPEAAVSQLQVVPCTIRIQVVVRAGFGSDSAWRDTTLLLRALVERVDETVTAYPSDCAADAGASRRLMLCARSYSNGRRLAEYDQGPDKGKERNG
jgi:hypothetical protein